MDQVDTVVKFVSGLGVTGVLVVLVYGLLKGWFVTGREHGALQRLYVGLQDDLRALRQDMQRLRDRDEQQQTDLNDLHKELAEETKAKLEALGQVANLRRENDALKLRVAELEKQVETVKATAASVAAAAAAANK